MCTYNNVNVTIKILYECKEKKNYNIKTSTNYNTYLKKLKLNTGQLSKTTPFFWCQPNEVHFIILSRAQPASFFNPIISLVRFAITP